MKLILSELQRDLRHRLAVYAMTKGTNVRMADKRNALLENSQLWRLLQVSLSHKQVFHAQRHACDVTAHDTHSDGNIFAMLQNIPQQHLAIWGDQRCRPDQKVGLCEMNNMVARLYLLVILSLFVLSVGSDGISAH